MLYANYIERSKPTHKKIKSEQCNDLLLIETFLNNIPVAKRMRNEAISCQTWSCIVLLDP